MLKKVSFRVFIKFSKFRIIQKYFLYLCIILQIYEDFISIELKYLHIFILKFRNSCNSKAKHISECSCTFARYEFYLNFLGKKTQVKKRELSLIKSEHNLEGYTETSFFRPAKDKK